MVETIPQLNVRGLGLGIVRRWQPQALFNIYLSTPCQSRHQSPKTKFVAHLKCHVKDADPVQIDGRLRRAGEAAEPRSQQPGTQMAAAY